MESLRQDELRESKTERPLGPRMYVAVRHSVRFLIR
jgi:hypothetical protein